MALNHSQMPPEGMYCGPCGCPPPPELLGPPPSPGQYAVADEHIAKIVPPILLPIGTVGNCLTIVIMVRQWGRLTGSSVFLFCLALSDLVILYTGLLRVWMKERWSHDVRSYGEVGCKFSVFMTYSSIQLSSWILVAVTMERVAGVIWPLKARSGCRPKLAAIIVVVTVLAIFGLNSHFFYGFGRSKLSKFQGQSICDPLFEDYDDFYYDAWVWIDFVVQFALPFTCLTTGNCIIIVKLSQSRLRVRRLTIIESQATKRFNKESNSMSVTLISLCGMFLLCMSPACIFFVYIPYWLRDIEENMCDDILDSFRQVELTRLVATVTNMLIYVNASLNFFLYIVSGSKFRRELKALFCCRKPTTTSVFGVSSSSARTSTSNVSMNQSTRTTASSSPAQSSIRTDQSMADGKPTDTNGSTDIKF